MLPTSAYQPGKIIDFYDPDGHVVAVLDARNFTTAPVPAYPGPSTASYMVRTDFDADGRYRSIEITALKKDLQVRARRGYYAPRQ